MSTANWPRNAGGKIGDRSPIQGTYYPIHLDLTLVGMYDAPQYTDSLWFHWMYLDEGLQQMKAIGFRRGRVLRLILGESCMIALLGGLIGVAYVRTTSM
ncbi:MAG: hypothetical protein WD648_06765 [Planctomycetaceae bacterium]